VAAYLSVLENEDRVEALEGNADDFRKYFELAVAGYRVGLTDTLDVQLLEHKLILAGIELNQAQSDLRIARVILNVLVNRPGDDVIILDRDAFSDEIMVLMAQKFQEYTSDKNIQRKFEQYLLEVGMSNSDDLEIAALRVGMQRDLLSAHRKRFLPEISLRAKYSYGREFEPGFSERDDMWAVGGFIRLPILSGTAWKHDGKVLRAGLNELQYRKDSIRFSAFQDITSQSDRFAALVSVLPMRYYTRNLASGNLGSAYERYESGAMTVVDLISIADGASRAELALVRDRHRFFLSYADLLHKVGVEYLLHGSTEEAEFYNRLEAYLRE
jgi:outer membrane protein TolC